MLTPSLDWELDLKPRIQCSNLDLGFLMNRPEDNKTEDPIGRPSKRQQGNISYLSPDASKSDAGGINLKDTVRYLFYKKNLMTADFQLGFRTQTHTAAGAPAATPAVTPASPTRRTFCQDASPGHLHWSSHRRCSQCTPVARAHQDRSQRFPGRTAGDTRSKPQ